MEASFIWNVRAAMKSPLNAESHTKNNKDAVESSSRTRLGMDIWFGFKNIVLYSHTSTTYEPSTIAS